MTNEEWAREKLAWLLQRIGAEVARLLRDGRQP
jgi:hypothetical protein